uniref:ACB domain-containing protein n=1 Tax=Mucochytrium quahogii TaxID=96639 RepID=A0A7S2RIA8_9STRA|mmetsp:Transcript_13776/g.22480  ORF Transcript_13776/g.22480 Transcript_13776/m.22480 type:complete len:115 (-) Transcript_13776:279-623(-)
MDDSELKRRMLERKFELAVGYANRPNKDQRGGMDTAGQLLFYGLYKQATQGPCKQKAPSSLSFVKRAKWDAWNQLGDMSSRRAMRLYLKEMDKVQPEWKQAVKAAHEIKLRSKL